jgi:uncharacterized protein YciI
VKLFVVVREAGPGWVAGGISHQPDVREHAEFMSRLAGEGVVLFAGPLAGTEHGRVRVLLVAVGEDEVQIQRHLAGDPWLASRQLVTVSVESWAILVGEERLAAVAPRSEQRSA